MLIYKFDLSFDIVDWSREQLLILPFCSSQTQTWEFKAAGDFATQVMVNLDGERLLAALSADGVKWRGVSSGGLVAFEATERLSSVGI
jgi:hypothetical protein